MSLLKEPDFGTPAKSGPATISLEVDGFPVSVPEGTSVMRAAALAGVDIPKLCATDRLDAFGSCRLCVVEIDGRRGTPASCTTPGADGMSVRTKTPKVETLRQGVMELHIADVPDPAPVTHRRRRERELRRAAASAEATRPRRRWGASHGGARRRGGGR